MNEPKEKSKEVNNGEFGLESKLFNKDIADGRHQIVIGIKNSIQSVE